SICSPKIPFEFSLSAAAASIGNSKQNANTNMKKRCILTTLHPIPDISFPLSVPGVVGIAREEHVFKRRGVDTHNDRLVVDLYNHVSFSRLMDQEVGLPFGQCQFPLHRVDVQRFLDTDEFYGAVLNRGHSRMASRKNLQPLRD